MSAPVIYKPNITNSHLAHFVHSKYYFSQSVYKASYSYTIEEAMDMGISVFREGVSWIVFQILLKGLYKHPNDSRNHPEWLFWICETSLRHIRNHPTDWKIFFEITFSKTSAWKSIKIRFLAYCDFIKAITTFFKA